MSYILIGCIVVLPVLAYDIFFFFHYYLLIRDHETENAELKLDYLDFVLYGLMGVGQTISQLYFWWTLKDNLMVLCVKI
jgi:hypothetical protein